MCVINLTAAVHIDDITDSVDDYKEKEVLLRILKNFDRDNVNAALREHFGSRAERGASLPDFIDPTKL